MKTAGLLHKLCVVTIFYCAWQMTMHVIVNLYCVPVVSQWRTDYSFAVETSVALPQYSHILNQQQHMTSDVIVAWPSSVVAKNTNGSNNLQCLIITVTIEILLK